MTRGGGQDHEPGCTGSTALLVLAPTLLALSSQLRAMTSRIIVSADARDPKSIEGELAELIRRTLELVDRVSAEPPAIERGNVIDVDAIES